MEICAVRSRYHMAMWLLQKSSVRKVQVLSRRLKLDRERDDQTSGSTVFQTHAATIGKARSLAVDRFDVRMANKSDNHDRSHTNGDHCLTCMQHFPQH